jgi:NOL1/NOP2/fmu family ribosome biogenesis protein
LRQKRILDDVLPSLKQEGYLIYSTCTFNHKENLENVQYIIDNYECDQCRFNLNPEWNIIEVNKGKAYGYQFFPGISEGEGFFISILKKKIGEENRFNYKPKQSKLTLIPKAERSLLEDWVIPSAEYLIHENGNIYAYNEMGASTIHSVLELLNVKYSGVLIGNMQKKLFLPDHALAMSQLCNPYLPRYDMDIDEAKRYLHKSLYYIDHANKSWILVQYENINLGWLKNLGNRINNYYPQEWRIRMDIT